MSGAETRVYLLRITKFHPGAMKLPAVIEIKARGVSLKDAKSAIDTVLSLGVSETQMIISDDDAKKLVGTLWNLGWEAEAQPVGLDQDQSRMKKNF